MDTAQRTRDVLVAAEKALATLASEAAKDSDYDAASSLIELAREVGSLAAKSRLRLETAALEAAVPVSAPAAESGGVVAAAPSRPERRGRPRKGDYPRFLREGDNLIKIGWSPSSKAEYEHKSPKRVLDLLAAAVAKTGTNGKRFSMDRMLPLVEPRDGTNLPDYQAYLSLAWLRTLGLLVQHGRQGYSLATKAPIEPLIASHWDRLPSR